ncbi:ADP-ribosylation factor-like protein 6-interacting protein 1 isoform X2 [Biomphalaria glabrata]|uniref:ADP-ribosylation factor-like protein 6-interacting protein 1 isoform X2 n=1 Tax=Biomphalaria glabrata TaxID=6526 RepID=A0A9W2ZSR2_BIOGL|nr:ADP-ribosylation factor-like protein 6-interacting protein 1 isoform X2 [Biomphalaria glabrata]
MGARTKFFLIYGDATGKSLRSTKRNAIIKFCFELLNKLAGGGDSEMSETLSSDIKQDLHGWREVLLPLESLLLWEQPYYPAILVGTTTFLFSTEREEIRFSSICEKIAAFQQDVIDTYHGLSAMRQHNAKMFFFIVMGILTSTAWIGNLIDNLFLTYLMVNFFLLTPGLRHHKITQKYLQPIFNRFKSGNKDKSN